MAVSFLWLCPNLFSGNVTWGKQQADALLAPGVCQQVHTQNATSPSIR